MKRSIYLQSALVISFGMLCATGAFVLADTNTPIQPTYEVPLSGELKNLQAEIQKKRTNIELLEKRKALYNKQIAEQQAAQVSLSNALNLLENRLEKTRLDLESNREEREIMEQEIAFYARQIAALEERVTMQRELLSHALYSLDSADHDSTLQILFGAQSFGEAFEKLVALEHVSEDLRTILEQTKASQKALNETKTIAEQKKQQLIALEETLHAREQELEVDQQAKESLLAQTQESEAKFAMLLTDIHEEQSTSQNDINKLQQQYENKLKAATENAQQKAVAAGAFLWPVDPSYRGISTLFHDPTYPFRHLFEHSGLDIPQPQGTPVKAATSGVVAWVRTGRLYGNYVMIVHANNTATLYAHLSAFKVKQDQFVNAGDIIALSGGKAGAPGSGLSTGPHVHFEVRKNGIPTNPLPYLTPR